MVGGRIAWIILSRENFHHVLPIGSWPQLVRHPNVYADTSGVRRFDYIVQAVKRAGAHKLLFGSDGHWLHPGLEIHKIRLLRLPPEQQALILGGNAWRLMRHAEIGAGAAQIARPVERARLRVARGSVSPRPERAGNGHIPSELPVEHEL